MTFCHRLGAGLLTFMLISGWLLAAASPASASCTVPPVESPHKFVGVVVETSDEGRTAEVRTDSGRDVVVTGAERPGSFTSVDRTYKSRFRYEFHPLNGSSPFRDNACTATRELGRVAVTNEDPDLRDASGPLPDRFGWWLLLAGFALAALIVGAVLVRRGRRSHAGGLPAS